VCFLLDWKRVFTYRVYKIQALEALLSIHEYLLLYQELHPTVYFIHHRYTSHNETSPR